MAITMHTAMPALAIVLGMVLSAHVSAAAFVPAPRWGGNNSTLAWTALVNMTDQHTNPAQPNWQFKYWYDYSIPASRYDHGIGNSDEVCAGNGAAAGAAGAPCTVLNADDGFLYLQYPVTGCVACHCVTAAVSRCTGSVLGRGTTWRWRWRGEADM